MKIPRPRHRRGVSSIVGTIIFVLVFMLAIAALVYETALQYQSNAASQQALNQAYQRATSSLSFFYSMTGGLSLADVSPFGLTVVDVVMEGIGASVRVCTKPAPPQAPKSTSQEKHGE